MGGSRQGASRLAAARQRVERWRRCHGGRGTRIPSELWDEAVKLARQEGAEKTARALRLDKGRLERRVEAAGRAQEAQDSRSGFVELRAAELGARGRDVVQFVSLDGTRVHVEVTGSVDVEALARAFWDRGR
jgi:hypothetical protein